LEKSNLEKSTGWIKIVSKWLHGASAFLIFAMMLLTAADVVMRYFFRKPILGTFELTEYLMVVIVSFAVAYTAATDGLVKVTLLTEKLPSKVQAILNAITGIPGIGLFIFLTWRSFTFIGLQHDQGISSPILAIPRYPFAALVAIGLVFLTLVLIVDWLGNISKAVKR
jgi:TRAP-type C4-dicarboxylate transport system permease small subunit